jgi:hypothetical protein
MSLATVAIIVVAALVLLTLAWGMRQTRDESDL